MNPEPAADTRPFAIQLEVEFLDRLSEPVRDGRAKSVSEIIRAALARFDLSKVVVVHPAQVMISVRLPAGVREALQATAKAKHTSVGQLVRSAVESYLPQLEAGTAGQLEIAMPPSESPAPAPAVEPPGKKPRPGKKAAKKKPVGRDKPAATKRAKAARRGKSATSAAKRPAKKAATKRAKR